MTVTYSVERLEHDAGEDLFLVKSTTREADDDEVLELEFVDDLFTLRSTDLDAYEIVLQVAAAFLSRGPELEGAEA